MRREGRRIVLGFDPDQVPAAALISRIAAAHPVRDLMLEHPPIEELVATWYRDIRS